MLIDERMMMSTLYYTIHHAHLNSQRRYKCHSTRTHYSNTEPETCLFCSITLDTTLSKEAAITIFFSLRSHAGHHQSCR
jgi:hypothetical protein